jgi:hypothetical protein
MKCLYCDEKNVNNGQFSIEKLKEFSQQPHTTVIIMRGTPAPAWKKIENGEESYINH